MRIWIAVAAVAAFITGAFAGADPVTDSVLAARAASVMSVKNEPVDRMLGVHKGVPVILDIRCSGDCPRNTVRIIHYIVDPGPACTKVNGDTASIMVPVSLQMRPQNFCIPHVLYRRNLYTDKPYQR